VKEDEASKYYHFSYILGIKVNLMESISHIYMDLIQIIILILENSQ